MFLYYKYVQLRAKPGQLFRYVLLFKVLRGVFFLIVIRILLHTNIIKGVASAKYFLFHAFCFVGCWCSLVSYIVSEAFTVLVLFMKFFFVPSIVVLGVLYLKLCKACFQALNNVSVVVLK